MGISQLQQGKHCTAAEIKTLRPNIISITTSRPDALLPYVPKKTKSIEHIYALEESAR